jgi:beta-phosphoglucomutase-like phosphatase (HAD superfamily)
MDYGLIFDMDGVLVNSNPFHKIAWGNFLIGKGYPFTDELFDTIISGRTGNTSLGMIMGEEIPEKLGLEDYFSHIIDKNDVRRGKPDPEGYLTTLNRLKVSKANCLVFEDSKAGVQAALAAGLRVIGISSSHTEEELLEEGVTMVIKDFTNLNLNEILNLAV